LFQRRSTSAQTSVRNILWSSLGTGGPTTYNLNGSGCSIKGVDRDRPSQLLTPTGKHEANNLEEGLTTIFQDEYMKRNFNFSCQTGNQKYDRCASLLSPWLQQDPDFMKKLRQQQNTICHITKANILAVNPLIPPNIAEELAMKF
jgi:hypothetical protein